MCNEIGLWRRYQTILFQAGQPPAFPFFAILTAYNPESRRYTEAENIARNDRLAVTLRARNIPFTRVSCGSPDGDWVEHGFAANLELPEAISIAKGCKQNALYWVEQGKVYLVPVLMQDEESLYIDEWKNLFSPGD